MELILNVVGSKLALQPLNTLGSLMAMRDNRINTIKLATHTIKFKTTKNKYTDRVNVLFLLKAINIPIFMIKVITAIVSITIQYTPDDIFITV